MKLSLCLLVFFIITNAVKAVVLEYNDTSVTASVSYSLQYHYSNGDYSSMVAYVLDASQLSEGSNVRLELGIDSTSYFTPVFVRTAADSLFYGDFQHVGNASSLPISVSVVRDGYATPLYGAIESLDSLTAEAINSPVDYIIAFTCGVLTLYLVCYGYLHT